MKDWFKWIAVSIILLGAFGLIGYTVHITHSAQPLWGLLLVAVVISHILGEGNSEWVSIESEGAELRGRQDKVEP